MQPQRDAPASELRLLLWAAIRVIDPCDWRH